MKEYKIGTISKKLGVSHDFIRYYAEHGLLDVNTMPSGYRYFTFRQSSRIIQFLALRNLGFSVKEIEELMKNTSKQEMIAIFKSKKEEIHKKILLDQAMEDMLTSLIDVFSNDKEYWSIETVDTICYLEHAQEDIFFDNEEIDELTKVWNHYIPLVFSLGVIDKDNISNVTWALGVEKSHIEQLSIPVNSCVKEIPQQKYLIYHISGKYNVDLTIGKSTNHEDVLVKPLELIQKHNYKIVGPILYKVSFTSNISDASVGMFTIFIPISDD